MANYRVSKLNVVAPAEGEVLPRWRYFVTCVNVASPFDIKQVDFLSDDENPYGTSDLCNAIQGLLGEGNDVDTGCP